MKEQAEIIDLFRALGIFVQDTTSEKYINTCLFAKLGLKVKVDGKWTFIRCTDIKLDVEDGFLNSVELVGEEKVNDTIVSEEERNEFSNLIGGY